MSRKPTLPELLVGSALLLTASTAAGESPLLSMTEVPALRHRAGTGACDAAHGVPAPTYFTEWLRRQAAVHNSAVSHVAAAQCLRPRPGELEGFETRESARRAAMLPVDPSTTASLQTRAAR